VVGASTSVAVSSTLRSRPPSRSGSGPAPPGRGAGAVPAGSVPAGSVPAVAAGGVRPENGNGWVTGQPIVTEVAGTVVAVVEVAPVPVVAGVVVAGTVVVEEAPDAAASSCSSWAAWPGASAAALLR